MKIITCSVLSLLAGICIGNILSADYRLRHSSAASERDTVRLLRIDTLLRHDTITITGPPYTETPSSRTVAVSHGDMAHCDSDSARLRAVRRVYSDTLFRAVVSGVDPRLDTLTIFRPIPTITRTVARRDLSTSRWSLGITAGVSATPHGLTPAITLGLTYRLWP